MPIHCYGIAFRGGHALVVKHHQPFRLEAMREKVLSLGLHQGSPGQLHQAERKIVGVLAPHMAAGRVAGKGCPAENREKADRQQGERQPPPWAARHAPHPTSQGHNGRNASDRYKTYEQDRIRMYNGETVLPPEESDGK
jgi:hypothetical protein